jgi:hypothetical protein
MMIRSAVLVLTGGLGLLVLAASLRGRPEGARRRLERPAPFRAAEAEGSLRPEKILTPLSKGDGLPPGADRRSRSLRQSTIDLQLEPADAEAFESAARIALSRIDSAWREREARVLTSAPDLPIAVWEAGQREAQDEYERSKEEALKRLHELMAERREYQPLRLRVESWIDSLR